MGSTGLVSSTEDSVHLPTSEQVLYIPRELAHSSQAILACSRLSVSEDDRKSERVKSGISCERDPGVKRRGRRPLFLYQTPLVARTLFQSFTLTESLEQAKAISLNWSPVHGEDQMHNG